jgi:hypothetical protein
MKQGLPTPVLLVAILLGACDEPTGPVPPVNEPTPVPCRQAVMAGVPILALEWDSPRETYLAPDHAASDIGIDYFVSPRAHVDRVALRFDFDPLTEVDAMAFEGECQLAFPIEPVLAAVPEDTEDVVAATVVASSDSGTARTGRLFVSTGTQTIELRTDGLDAGEPADGEWWALFEPAAGNARLVIAPATLDRTTFRFAGIPAGQPGTVALIQTRALQYDAGTRAIYAPWGFAGSWRRFARSWYGAVLWQQPDRLVALTPIIPPDVDAAPVHAPGAAFADGGDRAFRVLSSGEEDTTFDVDCGAQFVAIDVLTFVEVTIGARPVRAGESASVEGACEAGADRWSLALHSRSMNGRAGAVLLRRVEGISP